MKIKKGGIIQYEDEYELNYELIMALGFSVDDNGYLYDTDNVFDIANNNTGSVRQIEMDGNKIKASISPNHIVYAGQAEIIFEPLRNIQMMNMLFSYYIKKRMEEGYELYSYYQEEITKPAERPIEDGDVDKYTCLTIHHSPGHTTSSGYFRNKCLKFIHMIFIINGDEIDLTNFDVLEDDTDPIRR